MRQRFYHWGWQWLPTMGLREWAWERWLRTQWLKPAPHVPPRTIDQPSDETGVDDVRLNWRE